MTGAEKTERCHKLMDEIKLIQSEIRRIDRNYFMRLQARFGDPNAARALAGQPDEYGPLDDPT